MIAVTSSDGSYSLTVAPGNYDIAFRLINFATTVRHTVTVADAAPARVDATLYLSSSADVVVTAKQTFRNLADLTEPVRGDQFEQADDRRVMGGRGSHRWLSTWGTVSAENVVGLQVRHDDINGVGLYHTENRVRLETVRKDDVLETSAGLYAQSSLQWTRWLRTQIGLRGDHDRFDVDSINPANSGRESDSLLSPKLSVILGPWSNTELYLNAGSGFHSNDARGATIHVDPKTGDAVDPVTPLVRTRGGDVGFRTTPIPRFHATAALWGLDIASELLFVGDAGTTEASRPSRRTGVELTAAYNLREWLTLDAELAQSKARFRDAVSGSEPAGHRIPGAVEGVASLGLNIVDLRRVSAEIRYRYFGPRPLIEDNSIRSDSSNLVSARLGYRLSPRLMLSLDAFNLLNAKVSDIDYYYASRLPSESSDGIDDIHFHPVERPSLRLAVTTTF